MNRSDTEALRRARELIFRYGWNTTCYQILNPGMQHWFAADGDAVIGFVTHAGVRVVAGAPVARHERFVQVASEFEAEARAAGERVCFFAAEQWFETRWQSHRPRAQVILGAQPVWNPQHWDPASGDNRSLRYQLNRAMNRHVQVKEWSAANASQSPELREVLSAWLAGRGLPPLRFLTETGILDAPGDRRIYVAGTPERIEGFLVAAPVPARNGWLAELTVRRPDAPNGTAELLVHSAAVSVAEAGAGYYSLGLSPLSRMQGARPDPMWLRVLLRWLRLHGNRFYSFRGLDTFKAKFAPAEWLPVYALLSGPGVSIRDLWSIAAAFAGGPPLPFMTRGLVTAASNELRRLTRR